MLSLYESAQGAVMPWNSLDALTALETLPQQDIDICLMCPHHADACDNCDGTGGLSDGKGRPTKDIDLALLREMLRLKRCNAEMCAALNISIGTLKREKRKILKEETL